MAVLSLIYSTACAIIVVASDTKCKFILSIFYGKRKISLRRPSGDVRVCHTSSIEWIRQWQCDKGESTLE